MQSSRVHQYILVGYHFDANCIHGIATKDRTATTLTAAWQTLHDLFAKAGVAPNTYVMDNEVSKDLKKSLIYGGINHQLISPYDQRTNIAEADIQTIKSHFKEDIN